MSLSNIKYTPNFAPGLRLITSSSFSAASSVSVNNCFSADYKHYLLLRDLVGSASEERLELRLRASGSDASTAAYRTQYIYCDNATTAGGRETTNTYFLRALGYTDATINYFSRTWISNPYEASETTLWGDTAYAMDGSLVWMSHVGSHNLATSYDGFTVIPGSGTITGTIWVYGLREAR